jgi:hypothetical protein
MSGLYGKSIKISMKNRHYERNVDKINRINRINAVRLSTLLDPYNHPVNPVNPVKLTFISHKKGLSLLDSPFITGIASI